MACGNDECQYWRWCHRVKTKEVIDKYQCADFFHFDDIANDARMDRMYEMEEYNREDNEDEEEDDE